MTPRPTWPVSLSIAVLLLVLAVAACAWAIFTSGAVTNDDTVPDALPPGHPALSLPSTDTVLVSVLMPDGDGFEDRSLLLTTPETVDPPDTLWGPVLTVLNPAGRYNTYMALLLDEELVELVEIEVGELLEDWSPWAAYSFLVSPH